MKATPWDEWRNEWLNKDYNHFKEGVSTTIMPRYMDSRDVTIIGDLIAKY